MAANLPEGREDAYAELGGHPSTDAEDVMVAGLTRQSAERSKTLARLGARVCEDQALWAELQRDVKDGLLPKEKFWSEWNRRMGKRWIDRAQCDKKRLSAGKQF